MRRSQKLPNLKNFKVCRMSSQESNDTSLGLTFFRFVGFAMDETSNVRRRVCL